MSSLQPITATVYQGSRRRYFSKEAAEKSYFWAAVHRRCECENPAMENGWAGSHCEYHRDLERTEALRRRFLSMHFGRGRQ